MITKTKTRNLKLFPIKFPPFEQLREEVIKYNFKSLKDYQRNRKIYWPSSPHVFYKKQWKGWYYFLGNEKIPFDQLREEVIKCNFKSVKEYQRNKKSHWLANPENFYKEWKGWYHFLGKKKMSSLNFKDCREKVLKHNFKNVEEYHKNRKKYNLPSNPHKLYKKQWRGWPHFLGKERKSFKEFRDEVTKHQFKSIEEYRKNRKIYWPISPNVFYKKQWKDWYHFLGKDKNILLSFEDCREEVINYKFKNTIEYKRYKKHNKINWPYYPREVYKSKWKGWDYFLGRTS